MRGLLFIVFFTFLMIFTGLYCESKRDPYEVGTHWDYHIVCENGFIYKIKDRSAIQVLNSDGTPLKCGYKIK